MPGPASVVWRNTGVCHIKCVYHLCAKQSLVAWGVAWLIIQAVAVLAVLTASLRLSMCHTPAFLQRLFTYRLAGQHR